MDETTRYLSLLVNIQEKMGRSDFRALTFLAKDHVTGKYENCLDLFRDLERKELIKFEPPKIDFWFLVEAFHLMGRSDLESLVRDAVGPIKLSKSGAFVSEKRKILFTVGEETGQEEIKTLKALLSFNSKVGKRTLDQIQDVWDCLDVLEERFLDSELVPFLRIMYAANARLLKIIDDIFEGTASAGASGGLPMTETHAKEVPAHVEQRFNRNTKKKNACTVQLQSQLETYDRGKRPGLCVILNNEMFSEVDKHQNRYGTNIDRDSLEDLFKMFGFEVEVYNDRTCQEMMGILKGVQQIDHKDNGALVVCTLSHGNLNVVSGACSNNLQIDLITSLFHADKCPSLSGKPKMFIFQACQGHKTQRTYYQTDAVVEAESGTHFITSMADVMIDIPDLKKDLAPAETDFLIAHSTTPGYVSYRFKNGSLYIQTLVDSLREYSPSEDVVSILVKVNQKVSQTIVKTKTKENEAQVPEPRVRLTKKFYLFPVESHV